MGHVLLNRIAWYVCGFLKLLKIVKNKMFLSMGYGIL